MRLQFDGPSGPVTLEVKRQDGGLSVLLPNGSRRTIQILETSGDILLLELDQRQIRIPVLRTDDCIELSYAGAVYSFTSTATSRSKSKRQHSSGELRAPMVGTITNVLVQNGEKVKSYQPILVIEAMKVLATLEAPFAGTANVNVSKGQLVQHGQVLAEVIPSDEAVHVPIT